MNLVEFELAGIRRTAQEHEIVMLESIGWKRVLGADQGSDAEKGDASSQHSPKKTAKRKKQGTPK